MILEKNKRIIPMSVTIIVASEPIQTILTKIINIDKFCTLNGVEIQIWRVKIKEKLQMVQSNILSFLVWYKRIM